MVGDGGSDLAFRLHRRGLLTPTRIYARPVRRILSNYKVKSVVHGICHVTGGGIHGNLERIIPANLRAYLDRRAWPIPPVGLILVVSPYFENSIRRTLEEFDLPSWRLGDPDGTARRAVGRLEPEIGPGACIRKVVDSVQPLALRFLRTYVTRLRNVGKNALNSVLRAMRSETTPRERSKALHFSDQFA